MLDLLHRSSEYPVNNKDQEICDWFENFASTAEASNSSSNLKTTLFTKSTINKIFKTIQRDATIITLKPSNLASHIPFRHIENNESDFISNLRQLKNIPPILDESIIIAITDKHGTITYANEAFCKISKYSKDELIGQNHRILKSGHHTPEFYKELWGTISRGKIWKGEIKNKAKDGSFYWVKTVIAPFLDNLGRRILGYISIRTDITEQKNLQEKIHTMTEMKYKNLYESSLDYLCTIDFNGNILDCNNAFANVVGYSKDEIIGGPVFYYFSKESIYDARNLLHIWKNKGILTNKEIWFRQKNNTPFLGLFSISNLIDENGKTVGGNIEIRDITEIYDSRKKIEENQRQIEHQYKELIKIDITKTEFLAMISHELKTPIVPIKAYVDILLSENKGKLNEYQQRVLRLVSGSVKVLLKLVSDLLDAQKLELGQLKMEKEVCQLSDIINDVISDIAPDIKIKGIVITPKLQTGVMCLCDRVRIAQVITNVIFNSIDFCPDKGGMIQVNLFKENSSAKIVIKDNGVGIPPEKLNKLFVKFYQIDSSTTREHGGSGLGLAVCKGIVKNHFGKIWAESEGLGKGTEIHILLPLLNEIN